MKLRWVFLIAVAVAFGAITAVAGSTPLHRQIATGGKIVYMSKADGQADIYAMDAFGGRLPVNLTHDKTIGARTDVQPVWSPAGDFVAFERQYTKAGASLMVVKANGTQLHALTPSGSPNVWNCHPSWSRDNLVFFTSNRDGNFDLYAVSAGGQGLVQLTHTQAPVQNLGPAASPDGKFVVFSRTGLGPTTKTAELFLLKVGDRTIVPLTKNFRGYGDVDPTWSPDGSRIAFTSDRTGANNVWMINADGTHLVQVTYSTPTIGALVPVTNVHPAFSPSGTRIVFVSTRTGATELFVIGLGPTPGTQIAKQLTFDRAFKANPSWQG